MSPAWRPVPKVAAAGVGGAAATVLLWVLTATTGVDVPTPVTAALTTLLAFAAGYLRTPVDQGKAKHAASRPDAGCAVPEFLAWLAGCAFLIALGLAFAAAAGP